jgi:hypothetical protein
VAIVTDYTSLAQSVADYLARDDLTAYIPNFIQNAESTLYKIVRVRAMETALSLTTASGVAAIPADYLELKFAYVNSSPVKPLTRVLSEQIYEMSPDRSVSTTTPGFIATQGANFIFSPRPADGVSIAGIYYARPESLSGANNTNWFTTYAPDVLLYGALLSAEPFLVSDGRLTVWQALYQRSLEAVQSEESRQKSSGGKLSVRIT